MAEIRTGHYASEELITGKSARPRPSIRITSGLFSDYKEL